MTVLQHPNSVYLYSVFAALLGMLLGAGRHIGQVTGTSIRLSAELTQVSLQPS